MAARPKSVGEELQRAAGAPMVRGLLAGMDEWARLAHVRLANSLRRGIAADGAPLAGNRPSTVARKGHGTPGNDTGKLLTAVTAGTTDSPQPHTRLVYAVRPENTKEAVKLAIMLKGRKAAIVTKPRRSKKGRSSTQTRSVPAMAPRDFVGLHERDLERAAETMLTRIWEELGFTERGGS